MFPLVFYLLYISHDQWISPCSAFFWKHTIPSELRHIVRAQSVTPSSGTACTPQASYIFWTQTVPWRLQSQFNLGSNLRPGPLTFWKPKHRRRNWNKSKFPFRISVCKPFKYGLRRTLYFPRSWFFLSHSRLTFEMEFCPSGHIDMVLQVPRTEVSRKATWHLRRWIL